MNDPRVDILIGQVARTDLRPAYVDPFGFCFHQEYPDERQLENAFAFFRNYRNFFGARPRPAHGCFRSLPYSFRKQKCGDCPNQFLTSNTALDESRDCFPEYGVRIDAFGGPYGIMRAIVLQPHEYKPGDYKREEREREAHYREWASKNNCTFAVHEFASWWNDPLYPIYVFTSKYGKRKGPLEQKEFAKWSSIFREDPRKNLW